MRKLFLTILTSLAVAACGEKKEAAAGEEHGHDHHEEGAEGARFAEGKGIALIDETARAIGLQVAEVAERKLTPVVRFEAQVYRGAGEPSRLRGEEEGFAYATAFITPAQAANMRAGDVASLSGARADLTAKVWKIETSSQAAINNVEAILEIADPARSLKVGDFVSGEILETTETEDVITVPRSAVLETSGGRFVFVKNGNFLLRTPIKTGAENAEFLEITDGLYAGDEVAASAVETLYLIELRATKGGGHSH